MREHQNHNRVFALGLGDGASHELVEGIGKVSNANQLIVLHSNLLARAGRGTAVFVGDHERLEAKVISQLQRAIQPSMDDVRNACQFIFVRNVNLLLFNIGDC